MALKAQGWLLERSKVRAKSMQKLLGHNAALWGGSLQLGLRKIRWNGVKRLRARAALRVLETPQNNSFSKRTLYVEVSSLFHGKFLGVKLKFISFEVFRP